MSGPPGPDPGRPWAPLLVNTPHAIGNTHNIMAGFRKRTRASRPFTRSTRRRRTGRFKGRRSGRITNTGSSNVRTAYDASNANISFRRTKTSLRAYRNNLWRSTKFMNHYRSVGGQAAGTISTPVFTPGSTTVTVVTAASLSSANPFWVTAGGAQPIDTGAGVPLFSPSSIVIRGGIVRCCLTNLSTDETVRARVWAVWAKSNQTQVAVPAIAPINWDPTMIPDFTQAYKMLFGREVMLLPGNKPMEVTAKLKIQKIDQDTFINEVATKIIWFITISETFDNEGTPSSVGLQTSHSLSFTGDAFT